MFDVEVRERFQSLGREAESAAPDLTTQDLRAWRSAIALQRRRTWSAGMVVGLAAGAVVTLTIGLVLGASTGYASAEVVLKEHGEPSPARPGLAVLKNIPPLVFSCGVPPQMAKLPENQQGVPIIDLPAPSTRATSTLGGVLGVRQVAGGNIVVNDAAVRQVKLYDSTLNLIGVIRDSVAGTPNSYGRQRLPMTPYLGDSTVFPDVDAGSALVVAPNGQTVHAIAPTSQEMIWGLGGTHPKGFDARGRFYFQGTIRTNPMIGLERANIPDSGLIIRADLDARKEDTIARIKATGSTRLMGRVGNGPVRFSVEPVPLTDGWAVLADGTVGILRGRDYHVDWIHPDGAVSSTPKLPFDWKRLTDEDKQRIIDSIRTATAAKNEIVTSRPAPQPAADQTPGARRQQPADAPRGPQFPMEYIAPDLKTIFDFVPPIRVGAVNADLDGNMWILPATSAQSKNGELVYDVVNPNGDFHRVRLPVGRVIVGFGKNGVVYMVNGDKANGFHLEKSQLPRK
jgi:hypothetical protein